MVQELKISLFGRNQSAFSNLRAELAVAAGGLARACRGGAMFCHRGRRASEVGHGRGHAEATQHMMKTSLRFANMSTLNLASHEI
jgi:hypothetical protein